MTSVTVIDLPCTSAKDNRHVLADGLVRRRVMILIKVAADLLADSDILTKWVPNLADIEGVFYATANNVAVGATALGTNSSAVTWSTTTLTYGNSAGTGDVEIGVIGRLT